MIDVHQRTAGHRLASVVALWVPLLVTACRSPSAAPEGNVATADASVEVQVAFPPPETFGVEAVSLHPTLGGSMLDFRYRVLDADKAKALFDSKIKPYLFDPSSGVALGVPDDTKLGALRASPRNPPVAGKHYYVLFSNGYGTVKHGSRVTVVIGDCKLENVLVD